MRLLVCGGRDFKNYQLLCNTLNDLLVDNDPYSIILISGMAKGADTLGIKWADEVGARVLEFPADWYPNNDGKLDRSAGPKRNQRMIDEGHPDLCYAFPTPKSTGTWDMIRRCKDNEIPYLIIKE